MKRQICLYCQYPQNTCVCEGIEQVSLPCDIIVIQHPKEAHHAKNTIRLATLVAPSIKIVKSNDIEAIQAIQRELQSKVVYVLYPTQESEATESTLINANDANNITLIFIDASWRQAYGIWCSNPWLKDYKTLTFANPPLSQYAIRKAKENYQLSTLEALSYALESLFNANTTSFYRALHTMQAHWQKHQQDA